MTMLFQTFLTKLVELRDREDGISPGSLILGIIIGVALVVFGIIKFLIPGE
jgi:hypothetical protein